MNDACFKKATLEHFKFLVDDFGYRVVRKRGDSSTSAVLYQNPTTAVEVCFEWRDAQPLVWLHQLIGGKLLPALAFIDEQTPLHVFDLLDLVLLRGSNIEFPKLRGVMTEQWMEHAIKVHAVALRQHGSDVLKGDFRVFDDLEKIVQRRAREFRDASG